MKNVLLGEAFLSTKQRKKRGIKIPLFYFVIKEQISKALINISQIQYVSILLKRFKNLFCFGELFVVNGEDCVAQFFACFGVERVGYVFEFAVICFTAGHGDEGPVCPVNHLNVMNDKTIVDRD